MMYGETPAATKGKGSIMSVRHIHARQGEYIAVHRGGGSSGSSDGWLTLIGIVGGIVFVSLFWQIILACLLATGAIWLIWEFRAPLWTGVCRTAGKLREAAVRLWRAAGHRFQKQETEES